MTSQISQEEWLPKTHVKTEDKQLVIKVNRFSWICLLDWPASQEDEGGDRTFETFSYPKPISLLHHLS